MMNWHTAALWVLGMLPWAGNYAQQSTTFRVSATVEESCDASAPDLAVGYHAAQRIASRQATLQLRATCTPATTYHVGLHKGTSSGAGTLTGVGTGLEEDHTIFGGVPAAQVVPFGDYADTITVRVYY
jgi:spore coat protein U-like protein